MNKCVICNEPIPEDKETCSDYMCEKQYNQETYYYRERENES